MSGGGAQLLGSSRHRRLDGNDPLHKAHRELPAIATMYAAVPNGDERNVR